MRCTKFLLFIALAAIGSNLVAQDVKIIANPSVSQASVDSSFLKKVYLGKKSRWEDGSKIQPTMLKDGETHESFLKFFVNKSSAQFSTFWKKMIFTGKGAPPKSFDNPEELAKYVAQTEGAMAYFVGDVPPGVKVLPISE